MSTIKNKIQLPNLRFAICALALGLCVAPTLAQDADVAKPAKRVKADKYPTMTIKGVVLDQASKAPLAGIQLQALGHQRYTAMTDEKGEFTIKVPTFTTSLYVYAPEFLSQQVAVNSNEEGQNIRILMLSDKFEKMYDQTTTITAENGFESNATAASIDGEIANKLGADIRSIMRSGALEGGASMFIRGLNSITSNAQPLIVVDGIEMDMQRNRGSLHSGQFNNILANISPDDIASVKVLKNATALYGARGANGVILIETKRGHSMATRIDANISVGVSLVPQLPTMMNAAQYRTYATEILGTIEDVQKRDIQFRFLNDDPNYYYYNVYHNDIDWSDYIYREGITQNYSVNVQGGDDVGMYNLSVGYMQSDAPVEETSFNRMNVRFNTDISITEKLSARFDMGISRTNVSVFDDGFGADLSASAITSPTSLSLIKAPIVSPYQYNKLVGGFTSLLSNYDDIYYQIYNDDRYALANPVAIIENANGDNKNKAESTLFNVLLAPKYEFSKNLSLSGLVSYMLNRNAQRYYRPYEGVPPFAISDLGTVTSKVTSMFAKETNFVGSLQLDWKRQFGKHGLAAFAGFRYNYFSYDNSDLTTEYTGVTNDKNPALSAGSGYPDVIGVNDVWKTIQWFGNVDYNYMNRYFLTLSLLGEANSRFGDKADAFDMLGVQWAIFPSVQAGWVVSNEKWFPKNIGIDYLRLNAGFDISGNDDISNYAARTSYTAVKFNGTLMGAQLTNIGNDKIKWESTQKLNFGLQANFLNNRLGVDFNYFIHNTTDLLTLKAFSNPIGGINNYWTNGGELRNTGYEFTLSGKPVVSKDWRVELGASVGHYKNEITKLPDGDFVTSIYGADLLTSVGNPVGLFYGYKTSGVFATDAEAKAAGNNGYLYMEDAAGNRHDFVAGDVHFTDITGDGKIDADDRTIIGDPNPDIYGNIFAKVNWKDLTLSLGFNYSLGNDVFNYQRSVLNSGSTFYNQQVATVNHWRYEGHQTDMPRAVFGDPMGNNRFSDRWIEDGSYLRLKTVNLSYQVPVPGTWTWLQGLTIWAEAQNLVTLTKYLGSDPEFSIGNGVYYQGIDCGNLAQGRSFSLGVKINL
ncbi:MAG: SusC/RagA family TonB-linked outer membrane protein [Prevotella sp.]|nr:SusC/RagA family TonB-linked outer membrane protein [Prevotella sp.]